MIKGNLGVRVSENLVRLIDLEEKEEAAGLQPGFLLGVNSQGLTGWEPRGGVLAVNLPVPTFCLEFTPNLSDGE